MGRDAFSVLAHVSELSEPVAPGRREMEAKILGQYAPKLNFDSIRPRAQRWIRQNWIEQDNGINETEEQNAWSSCRGAASNESD